MGKSSRDLMAFLPDSFDTIETYIFFFLNQATILGKNLKFLHKINAEGESLGIGSQCVQRWVERPG